MPEWLPMVVSVGAVLLGAALGLAMRAAGAALDARIATLREAIQTLQAEVLRLRQLADTNRREIADVASMRALEERIDGRLDRIESQLGGVSRAVAKMQGEVTALRGRRHRPDEDSIP